MSQLRTVREARINFIFFQDIITCVMGILILVTLMLSLSLGGDEAGTPEEQKIESDLRQTKEALAQIEDQNRSAEQKALQLASLPDRAALETQLAILKRVAAQSSKQLRESQNAAAALKAQQERVVGQAQQATNIEKEIATLQQQLDSTRAELLAARANTNSVYIIPAPEAQDAKRQPVAIIVSGNKMQIRRLSGGAPQEHAIISGATDLRPILATLDPAREYVVFYFRPSGARWFVEFRQLARSLGFAVGYDAIEEQQQLVFPSQ
jgi:hypothetical protein